MHLFTITERHVDDGLPKGFVLRTLVRLTVDESVERSHSIVREPRALPIERKVRVRVEMNGPGAERAQVRDCFRTQVLLLVSPHQRLLEFPCCPENRRIDLVDDASAVSPPLQLPR